MNDRERVFWCISAWVFVKLCFECTKNVIFKFQIPIPKLWMFDDSGTKRSMVKTCDKSEWPHKLALYWKPSIMGNCSKAYICKTSWDVCKQRRILSSMSIFTLCSSSWQHFHSQLIRACYSLNLTMSDFHGEMEGWSIPDRARNYMKTDHQNETANFELIEFVSIENDHI